MVDADSGEARIRGEAAALLGVPQRTLVHGPAPFPHAAWDVGGLAAASIAVFGDALAALLLEIGSGASVAVDRALAGAWFASALRPVTGSAPSPWDPIAGDYPTRDGWIRLHTNAPRHRAAAVRVLAVPEERAAVAEATSRWHAEDLEAAVVSAGGAAAATRSPAAWARHPQGVAVTAEPLILLERTDAVDLAASTWRPDPARPLTGLRVVDLTRVVAGPVATRALAAYGATVLRIDPPDWDEPALVPEMTLGKAAARLDARGETGRRALAGLLATADVVVHGYRRDALSRLGLGDDERRRIRPGVVDVALTAYGWTGPWAGRRGFDSLVQMSAGIAERGMQVVGGGRPIPLPVQALDHATGWLMAAAVVAALRDRLRTGRGAVARLSLARTAAALPTAQPGIRAAVEAPTASLAPLLDGWVMVRPPVDAVGTPFRFDRTAAALGADEAAWPG